jgi:hypothetical protein
MITIQNKKVELKSGVTCYAKMIKDCLDFPPPNGFTTSVMTKRLKVHVKIDESKPKMQFDDLEMETIREAVKNTTWAFCSQVIIDFEKDLGI